MTMSFEPDGRGASPAALVLRGMAAALLAIAVVAAGIARSEGVFERSVPVTARLADAGDGLPDRSDVKYLGVLVGTVTAVEAGTPNAVRIELKPDQAPGIPDTVTARVVPSNVFAVPSVQLVPNGQGAPLRAGAEIQEDRGLATVQLQTSLTALSRIAAAAGRAPDDPTVGLLELVRVATGGRGDRALAAAAQLERIVAALRDTMAGGEALPTLEALAAAVTGLRSAAPDLLDAVHHSVLPMRTLAEQRDRLTALVTGGVTTTGSAGTALANHTGTITGITANMAPVLDILAAGSPNFVQMTTSQRNIAERFDAEFWRPESQSAVAKIIIELTPHRLYTRADCPRYGDLAGPSCVTGPAGPGVLPGSPR